MAVDEFGEGALKRAVKRRPVRVIEAAEGGLAAIVIAVAQLAFGEEAVSNAVSWAVGVSAAISIGLKELAQTFTTSWLDPLMRLEDAMDGEDCEEGKPGDDV